MDKLSALIDEKRRKIEDLAHQLDIARIELAALENAAELRPAAESSSPGLSKAERSPIRPRARGTRGRQAGAISGEWKAALSAMYAAGNRRLGYKDIHECYRKAGGDVAEASARDRVRSYVASGLLEGDASRGFRVTSKAAESFGWLQKVGAPPANAEVLQ